MAWRLLKRTATAFKGCLCGGGFYTIYSLKMAYGGRDVWSICNYIYCVWLLL